jgi:nitroimidazol reductase NimA-like FMN-containing flavoprotein (pyridoxamine 5'-phosphate oxidase superfamily)
MTVDELGAYGLEQLTDDEIAAFLAYSAESPYNWESVSVTGRLEPVPESEWDDIDDLLAEAWRPGLIEEWSGVKHTGLPPGVD